MQTMAFVNDFRYVNVRPLTQKKGLTWLACLTKIRRHEPAIKAYLEDYVQQEYYGQNGDELGDYEALFLRRSSAAPSLPLPLFIVDCAVGVFLVHLGVLKDVCSALDMEYPEKSVTIRLESLKRRDVYLRRVKDINGVEAPLPLIDRAEVRKLAKDVKYIDYILEKMECHAAVSDSPISRGRIRLMEQVLNVEKIVQAAKLEAYKTHLGLAESDNGEEREERQERQEVLAAAAGTPALCFCEM